MNRLILLLLLVPSLAFGQGYLSGPDQVKVVSEGGETVEVSRGAMQTISVDLFETYEEDHYFVKTWLNVVGVTGTVVYFMFRTPDTTTQIHARSSISAESEFTIEIFEEATVSVDGTPVLGLNNWRDSVNVAALTAFAGPTVTDEGDLIWAAKVGSGKDATVAPGFNYEIVAKRNSIYLFKLTKIANTDAWVDVDFWWYEHTPTD